MAEKFDPQIKKTSVYAGRLVKKKLINFVKSTSLSIQEIFATPQRWSTLVNKYRFTTWPSYFPSLRYTFRIKINLN